MDDSKILYVYCIWIRLILRARNCRKGLKFQDGSFPATDFVNAAKAKFYTISDITW